MFWVEFSGGFEGFFDGVCGFVGFFWLVFLGGGV